jgi:hypothetical protein
LRNVPPAHWRLSASTTRNPATSAIAEAQAIIDRLPLTKATIAMMPLLVIAPITSDCGDA